MLEKINDYFACGYDSCGYDSRNYVNTVFLSGSGHILVNPPVELEGWNNLICDARFLHTSFLTSNY